MSPSRASRLTLRDALPRGEQAPKLNRIMTELQMVLHDVFDAPIAPNAIWFWGAALMPDSPLETSPRSPRKFPLLYTEDAYARGVYLMHGVEQHIQPLPSSLDAALSSEAESSLVIVLRELDLERLENGWLEPALRQLQSRTFDRVRVFLNGYHLNAQRSWLRRWFARPASLEQLVGDGRNT